MMASQHSQAYFPPTQFNQSYHYGYPSIKRWKVSCFRHEKSSSDTSNHESIDDILHEDLRESDFTKPCSPKEDSVSNLREAAATVRGSIDTPWDVPWTLQTILKVSLLWTTAFWFVGSWLVPFGADIMGYNRETMTYRGQAFLSLLTDVMEGLAGGAILYHSLSRFRPLPSDWFRFSLKGNWLFDVVVGCLMFPLVNRLSQFNLDLLPILPPTSVSSIEQSIIAQDPVAMAVYAMLLMVCSPIWEELVFRVEALEHPEVHRFDALELSGFGASGGSQFGGELRHPNLVMLFGYCCEDDHRQLFLCVCVGLWAGLIIGFVTEYYTSNAYSPVQDVADSCRTGAATNVIFGLALGYKYVIIPIFAIAVSIFVSFSFAAMYGIAVAALGMLNTIATGLAIDAYGPISDNAGGIAEMAGMSHRIRERTDALDAARNTTAAIGKKFNYRHSHMPLPRGLNPGSAALVSLTLFGAYVSRASITTVDVLTPKVFIGLLVGAMLPYWFSVMTMKSVGSAALKMVEEVRRQFNTIPGLMEGTAKPDYATCFKISTDASLKEMISPGALVMLTPLIVGILLGIEN
ncbi:hypothetical protein AgCh_021295 [Apium graveolens]